MIDDEVMITASDSTLNKLDGVLNHALRIITEAANSTPIGAMELHLDHRRENVALKMYERLQRVNVGFRKAYEPAKSRLKTQIDFITESPKRLSVLYFFA